MFCVAQPKKVDFKSNQMYFYCPIVKFVLGQSATAAAEQYILRHIKQDPE